MCIHVYKILLLFGCIDILVHICTCILHENVTSFNELQGNELDCLMIFMPPFEKRGHIVLHLLVGRSVCP